MSNKSEFVKVIMINFLNDIRNAENPISNNRKLINRIGPRYCPSIEDKLNTFADKDQHQLFLELDGRSTNDYYLNGFSDRKSVV